MRFAIVHHTAGQNDYTRAQAPAIVEGIELYHVQGNGWNDIGYNFLVDRFGTIYEGRYGGIDKNVVGAHALGFNTGSAGVAVIGTFDSKAPLQVAQDALARLLSWRLDVAHVNPLGLLTVISGGSERYAKGIPVTLRTISGHRDTGFTECPGNALYARLDAIAAAAASIGGPKIYAPRADVNEVGARFRATLSTSLSWTVSITDTSGAEVARGTGTGKSVDWTWGANGVPAATYSWSIRAGTARPATGKLKAGGTAPALAIQEPSASPPAISPNGDLQADTSLVSFTLSIPANVTRRRRVGAGLRRRDGGRPRIHGCGPPPGGRRRLGAPRRGVHGARVGADGCRGVGRDGDPARGQPHARHGRRWLRPRSRRTATAASTA